jgi:hypothetical protein
LFEYFQTIVRKKAQGSPMCAETVSGFSRIPVGRKMKMPGKPGTFSQMNKSRILKLYLQRTFVWWLPE